MQPSGFGIDWINLALWTGVALIPVVLVLTLIRKWETQ